MRRKTRYVPNAKSRAFVYVCALIALLAYAIPRIPSLKPGLGGTFSMVWLLFVALAVASNLYFLFGADKERSKMLEVREITRERPSDEGERRRAFE
jgi:hypothetical protein